MPVARLRLSGFRCVTEDVEALKAALPGFTVLQGMVPFNVVHLGNGRFHKSVSGILWVEDHEITRALAERIGKRPGGLRLSSDMRAVAWGKLLINAVLLLNRR